MAICEKVWALCLLVGMATGAGAQVYQSCSDVIQESGGTSQNVTDGEFPIFLPSLGLAVSLYCFGLKGGNPTEYLTLASGDSNNFASFYDNVGVDGGCADKMPRQLYRARGRTEYSRIRLRIPDLTVDTSDFQFAKRLGPNWNSYGSAGDDFASSAKCPPMGSFKVDLTGTPFIVSPSVQWTWTGRFANGSTNGKALVSNDTYLGCYEDQADRLLPVGPLRSNSMTPDYCIKQCQQRGFRYAGVEYHDECLCGNSKDKHGLAKEQECNAACKGDKSRMCGGVWRISVFRTGPNQVLQGRCGGFPGGCFPALNSDPKTTAMTLQVVDHHPCLQGICQNEAKCIALSDISYKCVCPTGYIGINCQSLQSFTNLAGSDCPGGMQAEICACSAPPCTGARFDADTCTASTGSPKVLCRYGDLAHTILFNVASQAGSQASAACPQGSEIVGCTFWDNANKRQGDGTATMDKGHNSCSLSGCSTCSVQARCKKYICNCQNGGNCSHVTGTCSCPSGYYGDHCELFDYCSQYETANNVTACSNGICQAVPQQSVKAFGGDKAGDHCLFPFRFNDVSYGRCIDDNNVGPPFACYSVFDGVNDYIGLSPWSPGPVYTLAAWVSPSVTDNVRRTIVGGVSGCRDFGLYTYQGKFAAYYNPPGNACTAMLTSDSATYTPGQWYQVAVANNGSHVTLFVGSQAVAQAQAKSNFLPTTEGFRIGNSVCCKGEYYKGFIKSVKIWKIALDGVSVTTSMGPEGSYNSTLEAEYGGLIGHYEFGSDISLPCHGTDHNGDDWTISSDEVVSGVHCNISVFSIPRGVSASVLPYNGTAGTGVFEVYAQDVTVAGLLSAAGAGYRGGDRPSMPGQDGTQGESYSGAGQGMTAANRGGGGGGAGGRTNPPGVGRPGGGGGYGSAGQTAAPGKGGGTGLGAGGITYGGANLAMLYLGSGGGSGGNAKDLNQNPTGGRGGRGGGVVGLYATRRVTVSGFVSVAGEDGQGDISSSTFGCTGCPSACNAQSGNGACTGLSTSACWDSSGPGGGGSGGSLYISGQVVDVGNNKLLANGGKGGYGGQGGCGGDGGVGRVHVEAEVSKGHIDAVYGQIHITDATIQFQDYSVPGQKLIQAQSTVVGNEVYRGCFQDDTKNRHFAYTVPVTDQSKRFMTPHYCITLCRQKGYLYSATEYGYECYCDNHFSWNLKKPDNDCNQPCSGDSQQTCGASYRMSVFGPSPLVPSIGFGGVQQTCQPWCVTADVNTDQPKWGYCDTSSASSTSWNIHCECLPGLTGSSCDQSCPQGQFGADCVFACQCNTTNTAQCQASDGVCLCKPGFQGDQCNDRCPEGLYGQDCLNNCTCLETANCDAVTGNCICRAGWTGERCGIPCPPGSFGINCTSKCNCFHGSCSPADGTCDCDAGYKLPFCAELCDPGDYGPSCLQECDCNSQSCDRFTGACNCDPGWRGPKCKTPCAHGTYGQNCAQNCSCLHDGGCDASTGMCNCMPGYVGMTCDTPCPPWKYGQDCQQVCSCVKTQSASCDVVTGACVCQPGYRGLNCSLPCPQGFFGQNCSQTCACQHAATCNPVTGACYCSLGFLGTQCQTPCPAGKYGAGCASTCQPCSGGTCSPVDGSCLCAGGNPCICPANFWGPTCQTPCSCKHGKCDPKTGACSCDSGWTGSNCDTPCPQGKWGANCQSNCGCQNGVCNAVDGKCQCTSGYTGNLCDQPCPKGFYGVGCRTPCPTCSQLSKGGCDPITGFCLCSKGFTGPQCDKPCPPGRYGDGCQQQCSCKNGMCDNISGRCICKAGFMGPNCDQGCPISRWGIACNNTCDCGPHARGCTPEQGFCICTPGFTGVKCRESCTQGTWGQDCQAYCTCNPLHSFCSPIDGTCQCGPGYQGVNCSTPCPPGKFGKQCSQACMCSNHGTCNPVTGLCSCNPGYNGDHCEKQCKQDVFWGTNCSNQCNCNSFHCDHRNGLCQCPPGRMGPHCESVCDSHHYGFQCAQACLCQNGAPCDPQTGACECPLGFTGQHCDQTCRPGTWGDNCAMKCSSLCQSGCSPLTGVCRCQPYSCLNGGTCGSDGVCACAEGWSGDSCNTIVGRSAKSVGSNLQFSLTPGQIVGISVGFVLCLVAVGTLVSVYFRHQQLRTMFGGTLVRFRGQTVEIDSGLPAEQSTGNGGAWDGGDVGFSNPLAMEMEAAEEAERKASKGQQPLPLDATPGDSYS